MSITVAKGFCGDAESFLKVPAIAFAEPDSEQIAAAAKIIDEDRSFAAIDGDRVIGAITSFDFNLTVPGGMLPAAGVSWLGVLPTDRRRGALRELVRAKLGDAHERAEPLAVLWASESSIYSRFGFGSAADAVRWSIDRPFARLRDETPGGPRIALAGAKEALDVVAEVHEEVRARRPGFVSQTRAQHEYRLRDFESSRRGSSPLFFAVAEDATGYVTYRCHVSPDEWVPAGELVVEELVTSSTAAEAALWRYVFGVDLMARIVADRRPAKDPLVYMLAEPRRLERVVHDGLWLRLVDVAAALEGRRFSVEGTLRFQLDDDLLDWNAGTYELVGGPAGARCTPTRRSPEIRMSAETLGALYLGGTRPVVMAAAGRIEELDPGAVRRADQLLSWAEPPWCATMF